MDSEHPEQPLHGQQQPARKRARPLRRIGTVLLVTLLGLLALAAAGAGWLLGSESGARKALGMLTNASSGALHADGVRGRLAGPLQIDSLSFENQGQQVTLRDVRLDWEPRALLERQLHVRSLRVGRLDMVKKMDRPPEPATLPASLKLPVKVMVDEAQVDGGSIAWGPLSLVELGTFALQGGYDGSRYSLRLDRLAVRSSVGTGPAAGTLGGQLTLGAERPFPLTGELSSSGEGTVAERAVAANGRISLTGSLEELRAAVELAVHEPAVNETGSPGAQAQPRTLGQASGSAVLRPFSDRPLGAAQAQARALDLATLSPGLPATRIDARLAVAADGAGELTVSNAAAGLLNEQKLPLSGLQLAFRQDGGGFDFSRITAALGTPARPAGTVSGSGRYAGGALTLSLSTALLDLKRLDGRMRSTRLAGKADVKHAGGRQEITAALSEPLQKGRRSGALTLDAHAVLADRKVSLERAELRAGGGRLQASGEAELADSRRFRAQGTVSRFSPQDLGDFPQLPKMSINGDFSLHGRQAPALEADLSFRILDSMLAGYPLRGDGQARLRANRVDIPSLLLAAGDNRLTAQGTLAERGSTLTFALDAPRLDQFGPEFAGAINASGTARGALRDPQVTAQWNAARVQLPAQVRIDAMQGSAVLAIDRSKPFALAAATVDATARGLSSGAQTLASLAAKIRFSPQPAAPLDLNIQAQGAASGNWRADRIVVTALGTTAQHTLDATVAEPGQNWVLKAAGGLRELAREPQWQGSVERLDATGRFGARLTAPAPLLVSQRRVQLDRFRLEGGFEGDSGQIMVEQFLRDARGIATRGRIDSLRIASLLKFTDPDPMLSTDLELDGEWNVTLTDTLAGSLRIRRRSGDIVMRGAAPVALGLRSLEASATATGSRLTVQLAADGSRLGRIDVDAGTSFTRSAGRIALLPRAPLTGTARIDLPSIAWVGPLVSPSLIAEGRVRSDITVAGTVADPRLGGRIDASGLRLFFTDSGVDLRQGTLDSVFSGSELQVRALRFEAPDGQLTVAGPISFAGGNAAAQLTLTAQRYPLLNRSDRKLVLSGTSRLALAGDKMQANGAFEVDSGFFDIGRQGAPQLSEDVLVAGRETKSGKAGPRRTAAVDISVALSKGEGSDESAGVTLRGRGLNALLRGRMRIQDGPGGTLQAQGTINVAKGTYTAYGRELAIEQGLLRFTGPINNPALDILAMRRNQEVEAGVSVRGTVLAPRVTLVSEPVVPDTEKLSWLVLGRGISTAGDADLGALQAAAASLLSDSAAAGVQSKIASAFGLDTLSVSKSQDTLQQRIVTLGKQISSRLYVSYKQGLETASSAVLLRYTLSPRLTVEAEAGTRSVLSLFYNISFD